MYINKHNVEVIARNIKASLNKYNIDASVNIVNNGKCIQVANEEFSIDGHLYIWIRLLPSTVNGMYKADISSITLPKALRRKGIFTNLANSLFNCKYISSLAITSVCTIEMVNWTLKNKYKKLDEFNYERIKLKRK